MINTNNLEIVLINKDNKFHYNYRLYFTIRYFLSTEISIRIIDAFSYNEKYDRMFVDLQNFDKNIIYEKANLPDINNIIEQAINNTGGDFILFISEQQFLKSFGLINVLNKNINEEFCTLTEFINDNLDKNFMLINKEEYIKYKSFNIDTTISNLKENNKLNKIINFNKKLFIDTDIYHAFLTKQEIEVINENDKKKVSVAVV